MSVAAVLLQVLPRRSVILMHMDSIEGGIQKHPAPVSEMETAGNAPQFLKEFSRENSQEERDALATVIRERHRERDAWREEQGTRLEGKETIESELKDLRGQIETYNSESYLMKIKDYFAYRNVRAKLEENSNALTRATSEVGQGESEKPEFREVKTLLDDFYAGEKEKWAKAGSSPEDLQQQLTEERLSELSVDDYAALMRRFPGEMVTHVTRQGIRDHASSFWHTAGAGRSANGFKDIVEEGRLRSSLGIALQEHSKEEAIAKFLHLDDFKTREEALMMYKNKFDYNLATSDAFADNAAVHVASENVMDAMYGSERGNEIFIAYPSAYVASQFNYGGKGTLADAGSSEHNDKWIYTKDNEGMSLDAGLVFIPADAKVDQETGSRYKLDNEGSPIVPKQRMHEILSARFDKPGFIQTFVQQLPRGLENASEQERLSLKDEAFTQFGITNPDARKALLDPNFIDSLSKVWGQDNEQATYDKILIDYFHEHTDNPYEVAEASISSQEYWERYFTEHPDQKPSKIVFYTGGDPSRALNEWREKNEIVKRTDDPTYGFSEHEVTGNAVEANEGKDRFAELARKVIDDRFPEPPVVKDFVSVAQTA